MKEEREISFILNARLDIDDTKVSFLTFNQWWRMNKVLVFSFVDSSFRVDGNDDDEDDVEREIARQASKNKALKEVC